MRLSKFFLPTLREVPAEAEVASHKLMLRAGMIRKVTGGIYNFLPLGWRVLHKMINIIREEMNQAGAQEVLMPAVVPAELWQLSGRWDYYGKELLRLKDRSGRDFCIGPTHEEVITTMASEIRSYRQLPVNLYQIQTKFRDEIRPRFGVMRAREFMMKDAYSFHTSEESLQEEYKNMYDTYCRIFERAGLDYRVVEADSGNIGGAISHEFMVVADSGEDAIAHCPECRYSANLEAAQSIPKAGPAGHESAAGTSEYQKINTPKTRTIEELCAFFKTEPSSFIKTLIYIVDDQPTAVLLRGDVQLNELKLKKALNANELMAADEETVRKVTGAEVGFAGPVGLKGVKIIADTHIKEMSSGITGANETDQHFTGVVCGKDFTPDLFADLRLVEQGDTCPKCKKGILQVDRGIEVGHIFQLGTKYSEKMNAVYTAEDGQQKPFIMGCYGIGVGRTVASAIEQNHDDNGIIWSPALAPFQVVLVMTNILDAEQITAAEAIYNDLQKAGIEVLLDDREERAGVKFKDADLIGIPLKVIFGKALKEGKVELKDRKSQAVELLELKNVAETVIRKSGRGEIMSWDIILDLLAKGESKDLIFLTRVPADIEMAKHIAALANTEGGKIVFGLDNINGHLVGCELDKELLNCIADDLCSPAVKLDITIVPRHNKNIVIVDVAEGNDKPYMVEDVCYTREGNSTRAAKSEEETVIKGYDGEKNINARQKKAMSYVHERSVITNREYRDLFGVSHKTAHIELTDMVNQAMLKVTGSGRSTGYILPGKVEAAAPIFNTPGPAPVQVQANFDGDIFNQTVETIDDEYIDY
ncbi:MAG: proline--tRNA ligase [Candidatus Margulisiibacteriota bacterium]|jgi:prolyl-tRNA synthetase